MENWVDIEPSNIGFATTFIGHGDECAMPQVSGISPFEECHLADQLRFDPVALLHFLCSQRLAPPRGPFLGQVFERATDNFSFWRAGKISSRILG